MRGSPLGSALLVMLAVWTVLVSGSSLSALLGAERATLLVFCLAAALVIATRPSPVLPPGRRQAALFALAFSLGFAGHPPLRAAIALAGLALGLDPGPGAPPVRSGLPLLISVVVVAPVFEELLYRERLLDAIAATPLGTGGATLVTSALFSLSHLTAWQVLGSFPVGILLALTRRVSGSVAACIGLHVGMNLHSVWVSVEGAVHA